MFTIACMIFGILYLIYFYSKRKFNYWKIQNVPYAQPMPIFGNYIDYILLRNGIGNVVESLCERFPNEPYFGTFYGTEPAIIIQDPELLKLVMTKDFYYFNSREVSEHCHKEAITNNIFFTHGDRWKAIRQNVSPFFSSAKMKNMFHLIEKCSHEFEDLVDEETEKSKNQEVKFLTAKYTMDCIGACVFGINTNVMSSKNDDNVFDRMGTLFFDTSHKRGWSIIGRTIWPSFFYGVGMTLFPDDLIKFFTNLLRSVFNERNCEMSKRQDMVDLFMGLKKKESISVESLKSVKLGNGMEKITFKVDYEFLAAQSISFFVAGYETSSTTVSFVLYELAKHEEYQERVLEEVDAYMKRHNGKLEYECVNEMPFTEACIDETLRFYPVLSVINREVVEDYRLPDGVLLKRGVRVHLPVYRLHRRARHFPEPAVFRPARFLPDQRRHIPPYTYMPFGEGPRICIGMRFAKMQMMAGLITYLKKYRFKLAPGMPQQVTFEPKSLVTTPREGIHLTLIEREGWESRKFNKKDMKYY